MTADISKKNFVFVFQIDTWMSTVGRIFALLLERNIAVDEFHFHAVEAHKGKLMIHCQLEKDRIVRTANVLDKLPGVLGLDWMESKRHGSRLDG